jgi:malonyl-CoA O-methyltransferase
MSSSSASVLFPCAGQATTATQATGTAQAQAVRGRIARAFARGAASYDQHAALQRQVADHLLAQLSATLSSASTFGSAPSHTPSRILDLGAGTGYCSRYLQQRFVNAELIALDLAEPMLQATAKRCVAASDAGCEQQSVCLLCADAQLLPLQSAAFDLVVSSLAVQWCDQLSQVFAELARVLRPGGQALLSTFGPATLQELRVVLQAAQPDYRANPFVEAAVLQTLAQAAGLHVELHSQLLVQHYASLRELSVELRGLGASTVLHASHNQPLTPARYQRLTADFAAQQQGELGIPVTWEVFYLHLHKQKHNHNHKSNGL